MNHEEFRFFNGRGLDEETVEKIKEAFTEIAQTGFADEYDVEVELEWLPEEGLCRIEQTIFDIFDEETLEELLRQLFLSAAEEVVEGLWENDLLIEEQTVRTKYDLVEGYD